MNPEMAERFMKFCEEVSEEAARCGRRVKTIYPPIVFEFDDGTFKIGTMPIHVNPHKD